LWSNIIKTEIGKSLQMWFKNRNYENRESLKRFGRGTMDVIKLGIKSVLEYICRIPKGGSQWK
jgi:hypothetical protein